MFEPVDPKLHANDLEQAVIAYWRKEKIFDQVQQARSTSEPFVFFEGPPTANAGPALHHVLARAFKDLIPRYQTMRGKRVDRRAGWDTHGLPVELQVEKKLGLKNKKEIEAYGIAQFNAECRSDVWAFKAEWEKLTERIGYWLDMDHPYITYENSYIESVWAVLKKASTRDLLYFGHKVLPYCTRCGTALSSHEVAQGYKSVADNSAYVKFKLKDFKVEEFDKPIFVLAWTTTPWTLPGNVALAVGKDIEYELYQSNDGQEGYIVALDLYTQLHASQLSERLGDNRLESYKGSDLVGLEYEPLFPGVIEDNGKAFRIYNADFVTTDDGTGVVHTAVMYGEDDYELGTNVGLPKVHTVGEDGRFLSHVSEGLAGLYVKAPQTEVMIINSLQSRGLLLATVPYTHDYPFCWRCDTPLLYYARDSWFIRMSALRQELIDANNSVNWQPQSIQQGRMGDWLENVKDWAISRDRYWGTPLPFWQCQDKHLTVIDSLDTLRRSAINPDSINNLDLHRPYIDEVVVKCSECGKEAHRVEQVADAWLDSGSMPFAQVGYPQAEGSGQELKAHYPADFISEAIDQTRGWFYTLQAVAAIMHEPSPYKNVICLGHILDEHGKKMSKSKGNVIDPMKIVSAYGADALRFYLYSINPAGEPKLFSEKDLQTVQRRVLLLWWNVYSFYVTYANEARFDGKATTHAQSEHVLDRWITSRLDQTGEMVSQSLDSYDALPAARSLAEFIDDLSTWYVRRSRSRFSPVNDDSDRVKALSTMHHVLITTAKLMAPFTPFMAEAMHRNLVGESVHVADWPDKGAVDHHLLQSMKEAREVVSSGLEARMQAGIKIRQQLGSIVVHGRPEWDDDGTTTLISDELNVLQVRLQFDSAPIALDGSDDQTHNWVTSGQGASEVMLDTTITSELERQGMLRELARAIQGLRKDAALKISDNIGISWHSTDENVIELLSNSEFVKTLEVATRTELIQSKTELKKAFDLSGHSITIELKPVQ